MLKDLRYVLQLLPLLTASDECSDSFPDSFLIFFRLFQTVENTILRYVATHLWRVTASSAREAP